MAHSQKPHFVFRRNGRVHLNQRGLQFSRLQAAELCASAFMVGSNAGYTMIQGGVKGTGYTLHSPFSPSLPLPCVTVCHHVSTGLYQQPSLLQVSTFITRSLFMYFLLFSEQTPCIFTHTQHRIPCFVEDRVFFCVAADLKF